MRLKAILDHSQKVKPFRFLSHFGRDLMDFPFIFQIKCHFEEKKWKKFFQEKLKINQKFLSKKFFFHLEKFGIFSILVIGIEWWKVRKFESSDHYKSKIKVNNWSQKTIFQSLWFQNWKATKASKVFFSKPFEGGLIPITDNKHLFKRNLFQRWGISLFHPRFFHEEFLFFIFLWFLQKSWIWANFEIFKTKTFFFIFFFIFFPQRKFLLTLGFFSLMISVLEKLDIFFLNFLGFRFHCLRMFFLLKFAGVKV